MKTSKRSIKHLSPELQNAVYDHLVHISAQQPCTVQLRLPVRVKRGQIAFKGADLGRELGLSVTMLRMTLLELEIQGLIEIESINSVGTRVTLL